RLEAQTRMKPNPAGAVGRAGGNPAYRHSPIARTRGQAGPAGDASARVVHGSATGGGASGSGSFGGRRRQERRKSHITYAPTVAIAAIKMPSQPLRMMCSNT